MFRIFINSRKKEKMGEKLVLDECICQKCGYSYKLEYFKNTILSKDICPNCGADLRYLNFSLKTKFGDK